MKKVYLLTRKDCQPCVGMKARLKKMRITYNEIDIESPAGLQFSATYLYGKAARMGVPLLVAIDENGKMSTGTGLLKVEAIMEVVE